MVTTQWKWARGTLAGLIMLGGAGLMMNCGGKLPGGGALPGGGTLPGACPADVNDAAAVLKTNFGLKGELEGKVKGALAAGANFQAIAADFETEVATACGNLAKDLGAKNIEPTEAGPGKRAEAACNAAVAALTELKIKAFGKGAAEASLKVKAEPPKCYASINAMADCAAKCDATVKPGSVDVKCEGGKLSGKCDAKCEGTCSVAAGAKCEGSCGASCSGTCEGTISGKCDGNCDGKCDGKDTKGKCAGTCDGKCSAKAEATCHGTCKGSCSAACEAKASGKCDGTCSGECSVKMEAPKCDGTVKPPAMSAECQTNCDAEVSGKVECTPPRVSIHFAASATGDVKAQAQLRAALEKNLPALLKVTMGMTGRIEKVAANVKASLEGVQGVVSGGGDAALKVGACLAASLKAQAEASVQVNVSVKASASASGSAGAG